MGGWEAKTLSMKIMKTDEVFDLINRGESVDNIVLSDLNSKRLSIREALQLVENGFSVSQENIRYDDAEVAYDADFDEVEWEGNYKSLRGLLVSRQVVEEEQPKEEIITIELSVKDKGLKNWLGENTGKLKDIINKLVVDLYKTEQLLHPDQHK